MSHTPARDIARARWIWLPGSRERINHHVLFRCDVVIDALDHKAVLELAASGAYTAWLNGALVGRGPLPGDAAWMQADAYAVGAWLRPGRNVLTVLAHNARVGSHALDGRAAGLIAALRCGDQLIISDHSWRCRSDERYDRRAPRRFWSAGFAECADLGTDRADDCPPDDARWSHAADLGAHPHPEFPRLLPRALPLLDAQRIVAARPALVGSKRLRGWQSVPFADVLGDDGSGIVHAACWVRAPQAMDALLRLECDDACVAWLDGREVLRQDYHEGFARRAVWRAQDVYDQVHHGLHGRGSALSAALQLSGEWQRLVVAVDLSREGWGFALGFLPQRPVAPASWNNPLPHRDCGPSTPLDLRFSQRPDGAPGWRRWKALPSSGWNDSLDAVRADPEGLDEAAAIDGADPGNATCPALAMHYEQRDPPLPMTLPCTITAGQYAIIDLGQVACGFPELELATASGALLDVAFCQVAHPDHRVRFTMGDMMKYGDRLRLPAGPATWIPVLRRTGRFLHLSPRVGSVQLRACSWLDQRYPGPAPIPFASSDARLDRIVAALWRTNHLLMQDGLQDSLKREEGTDNTSGKNYDAILAHYGWGDTSLTPFHLERMLRTQERSGWFDTHPVSSNNEDEATQMLMAMRWARDWWFETGDDALARAWFAPLRAGLRFFDRMINRHGLIDGRNVGTQHAPELWYLTDELYDIPGYCGRNEVALLGPNLSYLDAHHAMAELANAAGRPDDAADLRRRAQRIARSIDQRFWRADRRRFASWCAADGPAQHVSPLLNLYALHLGAGSAHRADLIANLQHDIGLPDAQRADFPIFVSNAFLPLLTQCFTQGLADQALTTLRRHHGGWLDAGNEVFGEGWRLRDLFTESGSLQTPPYEFEIHTYATSALLPILRHVLGLRATAPGWTVAECAPVPGDLTAASGGIRTVRGEIRVSWRIDNGMFDCSVQVPRGVVLRIVTPDGCQAGRCVVTETAANA